MLYICSCEQTTQHSLWTLIMNSTDRKNKIRISRRRKLKKQRDQLMLLNASKKTLDRLDKQGSLPKIVKQKLGR